MQDQMSVEKHSYSFKHPLETKLKMSQKVHIRGVVNLGECLRNDFDAT